MSKLSDVFCGVMSIGTYIPKKYITAKNIAKQAGLSESIVIEKFGIIKKNIPSKKDT